MSNCPRELRSDSITISLPPEMFPWAKFHRAKGGVKTHALPDHDDYLRTTYQEPGPLAVQDSWYESSGFA